MKRIALVVLPWLLSGPALVLSLSMALGSGMDIASRWGTPGADGPVDASAGGAWQIAPLAVLAVGVPCAWLVLAAMTVAWCAQRRLARGWPLAGTTLAVASLLAFGVLLGPMGLFMSLVYAAPGIVLAVLLCRYHLGTRDGTPT